jgi:hypothetical protein
MHFQYQLMEDDLHKVFGRYGAVDRIHVDDNWTSAMITFQHQHNAQHAMTDLNGKVLCGLDGTLRLSWAQPGSAPSSLTTQGCTRQPHPSDAGRQLCTAYGMGTVQVPCEAAAPSVQMPAAPPSCIFSVSVEGMHFQYQLMEDDVHKVFGRYGAVDRIHIDENGTSAMITFQHQHNAQHAMTDLNGKVLCSLDGTLRLSWAQPGTAPHPSDAGRQLCTTQIKRRKQLQATPDHVLAWREHWRRAAWAAPDKWLASALSDEALLRTLSDRFFNEYAELDDGSMKFEQVKLLTRDLATNLNKTPHSDDVLYYLRAKFEDVTPPLVDGGSSEKDKFQEFFKAVVSLWVDIDVTIQMLNGTDVGVFQVTCNSLVADLVKRIEAQIGPPADPRYAWQLLSGSDELGERVLPDVSTGFPLTLVARDSWPSLKENELELIVDAPFSYEQGESVRSPPLLLGDVSFRLLVFPKGTQCTKALTYLSAFVEAVPDADVGLESVIPDVQYDITVVNWSNYDRSPCKEDTHTFTESLRDRGWHDLVKLEQLPFMMGPDGVICIRASIDPGTVQHRVCE